MAKFFISDTHFYHGKILEYEPWRQSWAKHLGEMHEALIEAWNRTVGPDDDVYHLGDLALGNRAQVAELAKRLNGRITITIGNHDRSKTQLESFGFTACTAVALDIDGYQFFCRHDPKFFTAEQAAQVDGLLHGHLHGQPHYGIADEAVRAKAFDVGVDALRRIAPIRGEDLLPLFAQRKAANGRIIH